MQSIKAPHDLPLNRANPSRDIRYAPDHGRRVTKEEYWARWYQNPYPDIDVSYEWNNGILEAKPLPNYPQTRLYRWFSLLLGCYVQVNPIAQIYRSGDRRQHDSTGCQPAVREVGGSVQAGHRRRSE